MAISPQRLHCVTADELRANEPEGIRPQRAVRTFVEVAHDVPLALTAGARAMAAEFLQLDESLAAIIPFDRKFIADGLEVGWSHERTLRTAWGSAKIFLSGPDSP